jgi:hypothetical protein
MATNLKFWIYKILALLVKISASFPSSCGEYCNIYICNKNMCIYIIIINSKI